MTQGTKTGGRQAGTPNKATAEIRELARQHAPEVIAELARLAREATSETARVAAAGMLLDRGYGKPTQMLGVDGDSDDADKLRIVRIVLVDPTATGGSLCNDRAGQ